MTTFEYNYQNLFRFCFPIQICQSRWGLKLSYSHLSSETQGQSSGREKVRDESFQAWAEEPLGTDSHRTISKRSSECWLLIGLKKMLCIIVPNRRTVSPEFRHFVSSFDRRLFSRHSCPVRLPSFSNQKRRNYQRVEKPFGCYQQEKFNLQWENSVCEDHNVS